MALGADGSKVLTMVLRQGLRLARSERNRESWGGDGGDAAAQGMLFHVTPLDLRWHF